MSLCGREVSQIAERVCVCVYSLVIGDTDSSSEVMSLRSHTATVKQRLLAVLHHVSDLH